MLHGSSPRTRFADLLLCSPHSFPRSIGRLRGTSYSDVSTHPGQYRSGVISPYKSCLCPGQDFSWPSHLISDFSFVRVRRIICIHCLERHDKSSQSTLAVISTFLLNGRLALFAYLETWRVGSRLQLPMFSRTSEVNCIGITILVVIERKVQYMKDSEGSHIVCTLLDWYRKYPRAENLALGLDH